MNAPVSPAAPLADADPDVPIAAAIVHDRSVDVDRLLADVVAGQQRLGRRVAGLLMTYPQPARHDCAGDLVLVDIQTRDEYLVSQSQGPGSKACRADSQGFARASRVLRRALDQPPDLVVCNRYGNLECEGEGFLDEVLALMAAGVPLLTAVATRHLDAWREASGGAQVLPAQADAVAAWVDSALAQAAERSAAA